MLLATLFQMTFPGAPCIYYGDEGAAVQMVFGKGSNSKILNALLSLTVPPREGIVLAGV